MYVMMCGKLSMATTLKNIWLKLQEIKFYWWIKPATDKIHSKLLQNFEWHSKLLNDTARITQITVKHWICLRKVKVVTSQYVTKPTFISIATFHRDIPAALSHNVDVNPHTLQLFGVKCSKTQEDSQTFFPQRKCTRRRMQEEIVKESRGRIVLELSTVCNLQNLFTDMLKSFISKSLIKELTDGSRYKFVM